MKIKSIQLKPFAGISNKKIEFCPGLTVILGPNESGKSTLLNALKSVLFTEVELTKVRFDKLMKEYMPVKGGDTIRVSLEFQTEGKDYFLEKIWKPGSRKGSSILKSPDQGEFTIDGEVSRLIDEFLPAHQGTVNNILLTWQSELDKTMDILHDEDVNIRPDLGDILRSSIMETDGVSVEKLRLRLDREYEDYFQHWDIEKEAPENGRGINYPYKKGVGKILKAYYEKEGIEKDYNETCKVEIEIDEINKKIQDEESKQNKIKDVHFVGFVQKEQLPIYYSIADLFVLPSFQDPFAIVLTEAMACGLPVVATNVGGLKEVVINKVTGILVPPRDPMALACAIQCLIKDKKIKDKFVGARIKDVINIDI